MVDTKNYRVVADTADETRPLQRSLTETHNPDGTVVYEYTSEQHAIRVDAADGRNFATADMLRKLAEWVHRTAGVRDEPPF